MKALCSMFLLILVLGLWVLAAVGPVHAGERYVFPLAGPIELVAWERLHWDGSDEVDLEAAPDLKHGSREMAQFERMLVVAVTAGTARRSDNERGGIAVVLDGDDGFRYYYAHLSRSRIGPEDAPRRVVAGEVLGTIGRTGRWSRYIETHLHFSITGGDGRFVNASDWFERTFGYAPIVRPRGQYPPDHPAGAIVPAGNRYRVVRTFHEMQRSNPDTASVEIRTGGGAIVSPLTGEVRIMRNTVFGRRVQITNRHTDQTVVVSGMDSFLVSTGDVVRRGDPLGVVESSDSGVINVMYFDQGRLRDPLPVMFVPPEEADHPGE